MTLHLNDYRLRHGHTAIIDVDQMSDRILHFFYCATEQIQVNNKNVQRGRGCLPLKLKGRFSGAVGGLSSHSLCGRPQALFRMTFRRAVPLVPPNLAASYAKPVGYEIITRVVRIIATTWLWTQPSTIKKTVVQLAK